MKQFIQWVVLLVAGCTLAGCGVESDVYASSSMHESQAQPEVVEKGPNNGRLLRQGDFELELAIFEAGVPPEFRVWGRYQGQQVAPEELQVNIKLHRLGDVVDSINFFTQGDFLRGDQSIYEPHSFAVSIGANFQGQSYRWNYDNFEGRTLIEPAVAEALEIGTLKAGPEILKETVKVYGKVTADAEATRAVSARFDGVIKSVTASVGQRVEQGQVLLIVESNESLKSYSIRSPNGGVVSHRNANVGEQTSDRELFTIMDPNKVWVDLAVFPNDRRRVTVGARVTFRTSVNSRNSVNSRTKGVDQLWQAKLGQIGIEVAANQSVNARVFLEDTGGQLLPGTFVTGLIEVKEHPVELAVKRMGLQSFRDFTVVYAKVGDEYEVRMLELGREAGEWVEVLSGLIPGTEYVAENSYIIKADIEKSGASHDH